MQTVGGQRRQWLPSGLAAMPPGPSLFAALEGLDGSRLGADDPVTVAQAWDRLRNAVEAGWLDAILEIGLLAPGPDETPRRLESVPPWGHHEVRAAFAVSAEVARRRMAEAEALRWHHRELGEAMRAGVLDPVRMRIFLRGLADQRPATCRAVLTELLPRAASMTPGELEARLAELLVELDPDAAEAAYDGAVARRRLIGLRNRDGSVDLVGQNLPVDQATAAADRVDAIVTAAKHAGHPGMRRTLRADVALGLLDGRWEGFGDHHIVAALLADANQQQDRAEHTGPDQVDSDEGPCDDSGEDGPTGDGPDDVGRGEGPGGEGPGGEGPGDGGPGDGGPGDGPAPVWPRPLAGRARPRRELRIRLSTLLGRDRAPATLAATGIGAHPVPSELALAMLTTLAGSPHRWRLVLTDPAGHLDRATTTRARPTRVGSGTTGARPSATIVEIQISPAVLDGLDPDAHPEWAAIIHAAIDLAQRPEPRPPSPDQRRRRHPDIGLTDLIRARDRTCAFPGCRAPATSTETDHTRDWAAQGDTVEGNLAAFCAADHRLKHLGPWTVTQPHPGVLTWTGPSGRTYTRTRPPTLREIHAPIDQPPPAPAPTDPDDPDPVIDLPPRGPPAPPPSRYAAEPDF